MAIEFHCPYCTAAIRVSDQHARKRGRCPKCATTLIVPAVKPHAPTSQPTVDVRSPVEGPAVPPVSAIESPQVPMFTPVAPGSIARSLKRKRRRSRARKLSAVGIPVLLLLLFFGTFAAMLAWMKRAPDLTGTLAAVNMVDDQLPLATVSVSTFDLVQNEAAAVVEDFSSDPSVFLSSQMKCQISADGGALTIALAAGNRFAWFVVDPSSNADLVRWIRDHRTALNQHRTEQLATVGTALCRDRLRSAEGESITLDAGRYRNEFGLNAHCGGFGYAVEAVAGNRASRCAREDDDGRLYFALPENTTSFTLSGRTLAKRELMFPGSYLVTVSRQTKPTEADSQPDEAEQGVSLPTGNAAPVGGAMTDDTHTQQPFTD